MRFQPFATNGVESAVGWPVLHRLEAGVVVNSAFRTQHRLAAALVAALLFPGLPRVSLAAGATKGAEVGLTSMLIVAQDAVADPNFGGSIVVVMNNLGPAPIGIIINRPMPVTVARFFPKLKRLAQVRDRVYFGGPVEFPDVWFMFRATTVPANAIPVCAGVFVSADDKLLLKLLDRPKPMEGLRIFVGHAGWAPGQLQAEIEGGAWLPRRADADAIFNPKPLAPWPAHQGPRRGT